MAAIFPHHNWFATPFSILGKLYSNTLLVSLNNRIAIRDMLTGRGAVNKTRSPVVTFRVTTTAPFRDATGNMYLGSESEEVPHPFGETMPSGVSHSEESIFMARKDVIP
ncbi:hypothetical protein BJV78DRAFT_1203741 [Lactifluus subvellereus]|nr:hypothetical protein BJV78DRAFT_1203741 [Lactifluus subvellereus]